MESAHLFRIVGVLGAYRVEQAFALSIKRALANGLPTPNLRPSDLLRGGLRGLARDSLGAGLARPRLRAALRDAGARALLRYTVECALDPSQHVTFPAGPGGATRLSGQVGLAPAWAGGACDESCQRWVSACVLARANARGQRVPVVLSGRHPALAERAQVADAAGLVEEGTFVGNLFAARPALGVCGEAPSRSCAGTTAGASCPMRPIACGTLPAESVTVYLQRSTGVARN
ncbi:MAG: hypothetical protein IPG96_12820 [Proteobacteria bacterium]|nr:hypothetical protein [Pseudomonadota bacterium]